MKPAVALVGRPNVGKSTLFNRLTRSRAALVGDEPGVTRDRKYGNGRIGDRPYIVIDTGGIESLEGKQRIGNMSASVADQTAQAVAEADTVILLVDGRVGINTADRDIAVGLRRVGKRVMVAVNKSEGRDPSVVTAEASELGLGVACAISAAHNQGIDEMMEDVLAGLPLTVEDAPSPDVPVIAVVGRPNVGKSTLVNAILGEERVIVSPEAGTTRDTIDIPFEREDRTYILIDTAGVRRRGRVETGIERFSVVKTMQSIDHANVVLLVVDVEEGVAAQDATLAGYILEQGRAMVVILNKWDTVASEERNEKMREVERVLGFVAFARVHQVSARRQTGIGGIFDSVDEAFGSANRDLATPKLTQVLHEAVTATPPAMVGGHRPRLKYAHQGGKNPPRIIIHGNRVTKLREPYRRYLSNAFLRALRLRGTPLRIEFREGANPYATSSRKRKKSKKKR